MPEELIHYYFARYGYKALFTLIFLQEIGVPNPIPNELVLLFSGYLVFLGTLGLFRVLFLAVLADFLGTNLLYFTFYFFGSFILNHKPKWIPISERRIDSLKAKISRGGKAAIYIGRLTPFIRGYTSVITGLVQIPPSVFLPIALFSAITWSGVYVLIVFLCGPVWDKLVHNFQRIEILITGILILAIAFFAVKYAVNRYLYSKD